MLDANEPPIALLAERLIVWLVDHRLPDRPYVVALSGGVDSAVVAQAAALSGCPAIAVTALSDSVAAVERSDASGLAASLGIEHHWVEPHELSDPASQQKDVRRCYFCKSRVYAAVATRFPQQQILCRATVLPYLQQA